MDASPLNKLPAEIRNHICELALHHPPGLITKKTPNLKPCIPQPPMPCALAFCCRQLYHECILLFYNTNHFLLYSETANIAPKLAAFTDAIGPSNAKALRDIRLVYCLKVTNLTTTRAVKKAIQSRLMAVYLNVRNNAIIKKHCIPGRTVSVLLAVWVDDEVYTSRHPYLISLGCGRLKQSLQEQADNTMVEYSEMLGQADRVKPLALLGGALSVLMGLAAMA